MKSRLALGGWVLGLILLSGCVPAYARAENQPADPRQQAAAEATQIILQAQATAVLAKAQAEATALILKAAGQSEPTASPEVHEATVQPAAAGTPQPTPRASATRAAGKVEVLAVGMAADGAMIIVQFSAPVKIATAWNLGDVYVVNEADNVRYANIPQLGTIGTMFAKPKQEGQMGYFMLDNPEPQLTPGDVVTVVLGAYKFEHVKVK